MTSPLKTRVGDRTHFQGIFVRYGITITGRTPTNIKILLRDVTERATGIRIVGSMWCKQTQRLAAQGHLQPGMVIAFQARLRYRGHNDLAQRTFPYKLSQPTNFVIVAPQHGSDDRTS